MTTQQNATAQGTSDGVDCRLPSDFNAHNTAPLNLQPARRILTLRPNPDRMEAALKDEINSWDIARRVRGVRPDRRISKDEAGRLLRLAMQSMEGGE